MDVSGIYCIENTINQKKYIGKSVHIKKRWVDHKRNLNTNNGIENARFQHAWDKYGESQFIMYILEECPSDLHNEREKYWIAYYHSDDQRFGYNGTSGGTGGNTIVNYSEDQLALYKQKKSDLLKLVSLKGEDAPASKLSKFEVYEIIDCLMAGECDASIARKYAVTCSTISDIRKRKCWKSIVDCIPKDAWPEIQNGVQTAKHNNKSVDMYDLNGNFIKSFESAVIAEKETGISRKQISAVCNGAKRSSHGYVLRFHDHAFDEHPIDFDDHHNGNYIYQQFDTNMNLLNLYNTAKTAGQQVGVSSCAILNCIHGKAKTAGGYVWKRINRE